MARSKWLCVILEWPILKRVRMTSIFRGVRVGQIAIHGLISFSLFSEHPSHSLSQFFLIKELIVSFISEYGIGEGGVRGCKLVQLLDQHLRCL